MKLFDIYDKLAYGNLNQDSLHYVTQPNNIFTETFSQFSTQQFPRLKETEKEISQIMGFMENAKKTKCWENYQKFMHACDEDIRRALAVELKRIDIPYSKEYGDYLENIQELLGVLIMRLKNHYNRARPYQVAYYTNQNLHPFFTTSGNTPAYPSGHAAQGRFLCNVVAHHYPEKKDKLTKLSHKIANSRIAMGLHYPSDNKFGFEIADALAKNPNIIKKYFKV